MTAMGPLMILVGCAYGLYYYVNLEEVPFPGVNRLQFIKLERPISDKQISAVLQNFTGKFLPPDYPLTVRCKRVMNRIVNAAEKRAAKDPSWVPVAKLLRENPLDLHVVSINNHFCFTLADKMIVVATGLFQTGSSL